MKIQDVVNIFRLPRASIHLMLEKTLENDPFYGRITREFHALATAPHPKFFIVKRYQYGFATCVLPETFEMYFSRLEPSAHRNHRKAVRLGYSFRRLDHNAHLGDISDILRSTPVRQGELPREIREGRVDPVQNPPSLSPFHDYPYFGVFKDGRLFAYASCLVAGELCNINDLFGHAERQNDGVVPFLLIEIARELLARRPTVKFYTYDTYFGAGQTLRRFKRKLNFVPHQVEWVLGDAAPREVSNGPSQRMITKTGFSRRIA